MTQLAVLSRDDGDVGALQGAGDVCAGADGLSGDSTVRGGDAGVGPAGGGACVSGLAASPGVQADLPKLGLEPVLA